MNANNHVGLSQAVTLNSALSERASVKPTFKLLPACAAAEEPWISYYRLKSQQNCSKKKKILPAAARQRRRKRGKAFFFPQCN